MDDFTIYTRCRHSLTENQCPGQVIYNFLTTEYSDVSYEKIMLKFLSYPMFKY